MQNPTSTSTTTTTGGTGTGTAAANNGTNLTLNTLANLNSPRQTVISGPTRQIDELITRVRARDRFASRVNIEVAPHNPAMAALQPAMLAELADLTPRTPSIPIISTTY